MTCYTFLKGVWSSAQCAQGQSIWIPILGHLGSSHGQILGQMPITCSRWFSFPGGQAHDWLSLSKLSAWTKCSCRPCHQRGSCCHMTPHQCCPHRPTQQQLCAWEWGTRCSAGESTPSWLQLTLRIPLRCSTYLPEAK